MSTALTTLTTKLAATLNMGDGTGLIDTLKATAFKGQVSDAQMTALMVVANQFGLNPWTKEIYAFPDRNNGIVPVVGVDGWSRIINNHPQFDGMDFEQNEEGCTCIIYRKDRGHPIKVTEWMSECRRDGVGPWKSHPKRMLRHKAMIQCARIAFGYGGIYDQDEAERISESKAHAPAQPEAPVFYPADQFEVNLPKWLGVIASGRKTPDQIIAMANTKHPLTADQIERVKAGAKANVEDLTPKGPSIASIEASMRDATTMEQLDEAASLIQTITDPDSHQAMLDLYEARTNELNQE